MQIVIWEQHLNCPVHRYKGHREQFIAPRKVQVGVPLAWLSRILIPFTGKIHVLMFHLPEGRWTKPQQIGEIIFAVSRGVWWERLLRVAKTTRPNLHMSRCSIHSIRYSKMFPARDGEVFHEVRSFLMQVVGKQCGTGIPHYNPVRKPGGLGFPRSGTWTVDLEIEYNWWGKKLQSLRVSVPKDSQPSP